MAVIHTMQGPIGFAATKSPVSDDGVLAFMDQESGTQFIVPTSREAALAWAAEIQRRFSGIEVAKQVPRIQLPPR